MTAVHLPGTCLPPGTALRAHSPPPISPTLLTRAGCTTTRPTAARRLAARGPRGLAGPTHKPTPPRPHDLQGCTAGAADHSQPGPRTALPMNVCLQGHAYRGSGHPGGTHRVDPTAPSVRVATPRSQPGPARQPAMPEQLGQRNTACTQRSLVSRARRCVTLRMAAAGSSVTGGYLCAQPGLLPPLAHRPPPRPPLQAWHPRYYPSEPPRPASGLAARRLVQLRRLLGTAWEQPSLPQ